MITFRIGPFRNFLAKTIIFEKLVEIFLSQGLKWGFIKNPEIKRIVNYDARSASINARSALFDDASASSPKNWGFGGRSEPPNGVQGRSPGKILRFRCPKRQENEFLGHTEKELTDN